MPRQKTKKNKPRSDGRYRVALDISVENGKRKRKYFYGASTEEATSKKRAYMREHRVVMPDAASDITLAKWAERWLAVYNGGIETATYMARSAAVNTIIGFNDDGVILGEQSVSELKTSQVQALMSSRAGKSKSGIALVRCTIVNMLDAAVDEGIINESPYKRIRTPKAGPYIGHRDLAQWEQKIINQAAPHHRCGLWAVLMMYAGLRREEMAALEWEDIHDGFIHVRRASTLRGRIKSTKSEAGERDIPIVPPIQAAIDRIDEKQRHGLVCTASGGDALTITSYRQGWRSFMLVCTRALNGIEPIEDTCGWRIDRDKARFEKEDKQFKMFNCTAHDLRYTYATMLYEAGVDVKTAAYLLGHKDVMVTMRIYTQLSERKKGMSFDALQAFFEPKS